MSEQKKLNGHDTVVCVNEDDGTILFIKTFSAKHNELERLAAIDCYIQVSKSYGRATISSIDLIKLQIEE